MRKSRKPHPCWFCGKRDGVMVFSWEFDTNVHLACVQREHEAGNPEATIIRKEFTNAQ